MRELNRTLTTRLPILVISMTCGCAFNFGQVNANGTINATADTKIDTKIDTTVTSSGSITQINGPGADTTQQSPGTPSTNNTSDPGPGTLYVHHVPKLSGPESSLGKFSADMPFDGSVAYVYYEASKERNQVITFTRFAQEGTLPASPAAFVDLTHSSDGGSLRIDGMNSGAAYFVKESGFMVIPAGKTYMAVLGAKRSWAYPYYKGADGYDYNLFNTYFLKKNVRFTIMKPADITTLSGAKIEGDFPIQGPVISF